MKRIHLGAGFFQVAGAGLGEGGGADMFPFGAERFNDGRQNEALNIGARREVRAKLVAFVGIQGAFQQRAENGGFDVAPILAGGFLEQAKLQAVNGQNGAVLKKTAVECEAVCDSEQRNNPCLSAFPRTRCGFFARSLRRWPEVIRAIP